METPRYRQLTACTSVLVGKKAMADGSTVIARDEDCKAAWPKYLKIHAAEDFTVAPHFKSKDTDFEIDLPTHRAKYSATPEWTDEFGVFEEDGINEYGVAMSATESAYTNSRVLGFDPYPKDGIAEEAMVTVVLPYVKTAREGIQRLGQIVSEHGTTESNGVLFSDVNEVWYMEICSGHHWVAQRIPDDSYAVVANQLAIQEIDFDQPTDFLYSNGLQAFTVANHLWQVGQPFNARNIFGTRDQSDLVYNTPRVWYGQRYLTPSVEQQPQDFELPFIRQADRPIQVEDVAAILSSHYQGTVYDPIGKGTPQQRHAFRPISLAKNQESHLLQLRPNLPLQQSGLHWLAMGVAAQSVYVPFYAGASETPVNYQVGTDTYSTGSAYWTYKLVGILVDAHYQKFAKALEDTQKHVNQLMVQTVAKTDAAVAKLAATDALTPILNQGSAEAARLAQQEYEYLTAKLITDSTDLSPLNFSTDTNL